MASESDKQVFDVSKPGSTPPDASGKPIIVSHKTMMKDPMVNEESSIADSEDSSEKAGEELRKSSKSNIKPIHEDIEPDHDSSGNDQDKKPSEDNDTNDSAEIGESDDKPKKKKKEDEPLQDEEKIRKLVESKKYFIKVRTPNRKRNKRTVLVILVVLLLAVIGVGAAADAELIDLPVPFDFIKKSQPKVSTIVVATPTESKKEDTAKSDKYVVPEGYVVYENKDLGFKFAYPKTWGTTTLQSDPANSDIFLLIFSQPQTNDKKSQLSIELRGQKKNVTNEGSDSRYTKGFIVKDGKYYYRSKDETVDNLYVINEVDILSKVTNGFGTSLVVDYTNMVSYHELDGVVNLDNKDWPGLVLSYVDATLLKNDGTSGKGYTADDQKVMEKVVATFSKL